MPCLVNSPPKSRRHKSSGKAVVTLNGRDFYLGPYGSKASRVAYDRLIAEWMANHRHLPPADSDGLTITELAAAYLRHAKAYYRKDGVPIPTLLRVKAALRVLKEFYGQSTAVTFGPLALHAIQQRLVGQHKSRRHINYLIEEIKRVFRWGTSQELVPVTMLGVRLHYSRIKSWTVRGRRNSRARAARQTDLPAGDRYRRIDRGGHPSGP